MTESFGELDPGLRWGSASNPHEAAAQLNLMKHLEAVPLNGNVIDIGAGIGNSMEALLYIHRPDLRVISIDPGYVMQDGTGEAEAREEVIAYFKESDQEVLRSTNAWYANRFGVYAYELPFEDSSADLVLSYAAVPEYSSSREQSLGDIHEALRVLKTGGTLLNGPMGEFIYEEWKGILEEMLKSRKIQKYDIRTAEMSVGRVYFSEVTK